MNEKILNNLSNELSNVQRRKRTGIISEFLLKEAVENIDQFNRQLIQYFDEQISMHAVLIPNTSEYEYDYKFEPNTTFYGGPYTYIEYNNGCYKIKRQKGQNGIHKSHRHTGLSVRIYSKFSLEDHNFFIKLIEKDGYAFEYQHGGLIRITDIHTFESYFYKYLH